MQGCIYAHNGEGTVSGREGNSQTDKALSECRLPLPLPVLLWRPRMPPLGAVRCLVPCKLRACSASASLIPPSLAPPAPQA